ncbi:MAG: C69 family dipeptidase [Synergistaceae bacterium]|jgi:dipeptidase|nr:C69 family dipeptidase [Synergistaceae bacterium]
MEKLCFVSCCYKRLIAVSALAFFLLTPAASWACTTIVIGRDASATGNIVFGRTEDLEPYNAKRFVVYPSGTFKEGETLEDLYGFQYTFIHDSYKFTGVPDMAVNGDGRYDAHGVNEFGVAVTATNTTRLSSGAAAADPTVDNGLREAVLTTIILAESKRVQEAITLIGSLVESNGAAETFIFVVADQDEAWIVEVISGHRWVASRVPDNSFAVIANDMVTVSVDLSESDRFRGSADFQTFAEEHNFASYNSDETLNIAGSYGSINEDGNTYRRWRGYNRFAPSLGVEVRVSTDVTPYNLFARPDRRIEVAEVMSFQRDRYEGTGYDLSLSQQTFNEDGEERELSWPRPIGTVGQIETHIYEMVKGYPNSIGARFWMAMAQSEHSVYLPYYGAITDTHPYYKREAGEYQKYQADSAFWIFQDLASKARADRERYGKPIRDYWLAYERKLLNEQAQIEVNLIREYQSDPRTAAKYITDHTIAQSQAAIDKAVEIRDALNKHIAERPGDIFVVPEDKVIISEDQTPESGGGGGCSAGAGVLALAASAALILRRRGSLR